MNITPLRPYQASVKNVSAVDKKKLFSVGTAEEGRQPAEQNVDRLDISGGAQRSEIEKSAWSLTQQAVRSVGTQRIEALREAVQNRTYSVSSESIADAMVSSWRIL